MIIAKGSISAPLNIPDHANVPVKLLLWDEWKNESCFNFEARLNRLLKVAHERRVQANRPACPRRVPLFQREDGPVGDQVSVSLEEAMERLQAGHKQDATRESRTPATKGGSRAGKKRGLS